VDSEWPGYCSICENRVVFRSQGPWHRDQLVCTRCGSIPRQRALMSVLSIASPLWRDARIWELAPAGPSSDKLRTEAQNYVSSHYWPDVAPGSLVNGVRCEDLERPTFKDASFDVVVSSDVFEHIIDVDVALQQIARVLDAGGIHVWTTPQYRDLERSKARVRRLATGLEYLVPAEYHGDPVCADGALVTYDWGRDLPDRVEAVSTMWTTVFRLESQSHGLLGEFLEVFVSHKGPEASLAGEGHRDPEIAVAALNSCRETVAAMEASRSWRLTRPLRALSEAIRHRAGSS
jgi:SAM-dependent methyltransferase